MKPRTIAVALAALTLLGGAGALLAPGVARFVAERQVDKALAQVRRLSTAVVNRGAVSIDIGSRTVVVRDLSITPPGDGSAISIGALTIVDPWQADDDLTAKSVTAETIRVFSPLGETRIPRFEVRDYSGLSRGLVATPGVGSSARTQADVIAQISSSGASAPSIEITDTRSGVKRTLTGVTVGRIDGGTVRTLAVGAVAISGAEAAAGKPEGGQSLSVLGRSLTARDVNLPTLWRFYAGDGAGDRDPLAAAVTLDDLTIRSSLQDQIVLQASAKEVFVRDFRLRALAFPFPLIENTLMSLGGDATPTPAETRRRIAMTVDAARAFSFGAIGARDIAFERRGPDDSTASGATSVFELTGYSDTRLASVKATDARYATGDGGAVSARSAEIRGFDATRIADYGARVGRDEVMMLAHPTADEVVRMAPRISGASIVEGQAKSPNGSLAVAKADIDLDAPLDNVPQKVAGRFSGLEATSAGDNGFARLLDAAALDKLVGEGHLSLVFDPNTRKLSLDALNARFEGVGSVSAKGAFAEVDPMLALSSGSDLFAKLSAVLIEPFKFTIENDGGFETLLARAAAKAGQPVDAYRADLANRVETGFARLFGPPAQQSAAALAGFIRTPRSIEVSIDPKDAQIRLLDFIQSFGLGPAGVAQTIDVRVLNRRS